MNDEGVLIKIEGYTFLDDHEDMKAVFLSYARHNLRSCSVDFMHSYLVRVIIKVLKEELLSGLLDQESDNEGIMIEDYVNETDQPSNKEIPYKFGKKIDDNQMKGLISKFVGTDNEDVDRGCIDPKDLCEEDLSRLIDAIMMKTYGLKNSTISRTTT